MKVVSLRFDKYQVFKDAEYSISQLSRYGERLINTATYEGDIGLVYSIECTETWKSYIGITSCHFEYQRDIAGGFAKLPRFANHRRNLSKGIHPSREMQFDWDKYGENAFVYTCLEIIPLFKSGSLSLVWGGSATLRRLEAKWHNTFIDTYSQSTWSDKNGKHSKHWTSKLFIQCLGLNLDFRLAPIKEVC